eukprot:CAMPEP_0171966926 /NCGR_PEP_ID=MMETSP0993-20121228/195071_1 /TAXON_ID=483369 /ORGANISM="non described non described, Strain CCMP2098" /LENGTH=50 /DNA_ID=CAMNT_0012616313 /DNA_START=24 /DNA_END=172 /DNA_ORIENTATION=+
MTITDLVNAAAKEDSAFLSFLYAAATGDDSGPPPDSAYATPGQQRKSLGA